MNKRAGFKNIDVLSLLYILFQTSDFGFQKKTLTSTCKCAQRSHWLPIRSFPFIQHFYVAKNSFINRQMRRCLVKLCRALLIYVNKHVFERTLNRG